MTISGKKFKTKFAEQTANENKQFIETKTLKFIYTWSDKGFDGTVVNKALSALHIGSHNITLTVPL